LHVLAKSLFVGDLIPERPARPMATLFSMTVDTEEEWDWNAGWPTKALSLTNIRQLPRLQDLCSRLGVAMTYYVNQAVLDDPQARDIVLEIARREHVEIGMHIHPWNTPPFDPDQPVRARETFLPNIPSDLLLAKLRSVYGRFVEHGLRPTSFRGGRYCSGPITQQFLRENGFVADSSVVPYTTWHDDGAPDYRGRDLYPVRLAPPGPRGATLWDIPLTMGFTRRPFSFWQSLHGCIESSWLSRLRLIGIASRLGIVRKVWLNFEQPLGKKMLPFLKVLRNMDLPCICFTLHSSSLMAGKSNFTPTQADEDGLFAYLEEVFATVSSWPEFQPATVTEIAHKLEESHHAGTWN
jgi:hypothetical protein